MGLMVEVRQPTISSCRLSSRSVFSPRSIASSLASAERKLDRIISRRSAFWITGAERAGAREGSSRYAAAAVGPRPTTATTVPARVADEGAALRLSRSRTLRGGL